MATQFHGPVSHDGNKITDVADGTDPNDAVNLSQADERYVEVAGDTMTGQLVIDHTAGFSIEAKGGIQSDDEIWVTDGGVSIDSGFLSVDGGNVGGANISGGFESYHDPATMPSRAVGFWRHNGSSYQPLMAAEDHEPVTRAYLESQMGEADKHYLHQQEASSKVWTVVHNLGKRPSVSVTDAGGAVIYGEIVYPNENRCDLYFEFPITGTAVCN